MRPVALLVTLLLAGAVAPFPGSAARASCVGPQLAVAGQFARHAPAPLGSPSTRTVSVAGRFFVNGCDDVGETTSVLGCQHESRPQDRVKPMRRVELVLHQHGRSWTLGTADATRQGRIGWDVRLPAGLRPGRAHLTAATSRTPVTIVVPRR